MKDNYQPRYSVLQIIFLSFAVLFLIRLFYLQVIDARYISLARNNAIKEVDVYPTRGLVYDRKGRLIVFNEAIYDIMVTPRQAKNVDKTKFCSLLKIDTVEFNNRFEKAKHYSPFKPSVFAKQLSIEDYSKFQEFLYLFPGFYGQVRTIRHYPDQSAGTILGDIGEVDDAQIKNSGSYYKPGDYVGKNGIEKTYEAALGGKRGRKYVFVDVHNREQGSFNEGRDDTLAEAGDNIYTSLDIELQKFGEKLMQNKKGSIVAIEPKTGEILAMVSSPTFDPNLLCGAVRGENFNKLLLDSLKPLFNRPIMATYSPGSTFKPMIGLIALNEEVQQVQYYVPCGGVYHFAGLTLHCAHPHPSAYSIMEALQYSCNPYFWQTFRNTIENRNYAKIQDIYGKWVNYCYSFGLGKKLGIDLPGEVNGNIPSVNYFNKMYGVGGWHSSTIISLGIGQGEILVTPIQLCNFYAAIANKGFHYTPHIVSKIIDVKTQKDIQKKFERHFTMVNPGHFYPVNDGLRRVVVAGTAAASAVEGITLCGKTGTVQNAHGDDHSVFAGYAPQENPKIAIAVFVENAGFGASFAGPIASLMVEKYLNDTISEKRQLVQKKMEELNLLNKYSHAEQTRKNNRQH